MHRSSGVHGAIREMLLETHRKPPMVASVYRGSFHPPKSIAVRKDIWPDSGNRVRIVRQETVRHPSRMNAMMRTAHPKPTAGMSLWRMIGKMTPPVALPPVVSPMATARLRRNQWPRTATAGLNLYKKYSQDREQRSTHIRTLQQCHTDAE